MVTGTIQDAAVVIITDMEGGVLGIAFKNTSGGELKAGQEVKFKADGSMEVRTAAGDLAFGILTEATPDLKKGVVRVFFKEVITGEAKGLTLNPGDKVRQDGTLGTDNRPNYVIAATGTYATGIVINGGDDTEEIKVGSLQSPLHVI